MDGSTQVKGRRMVAKFKASLFYKRRLSKKTKPETNNNNKTDVKNWRKGIRRRGVERGN